LDFLVKFSAIFITLSEIEPNIESWHSESFNIGCLENKSVNIIGSAKIGGDKLWLAR
jgi:hypothetical protein